MILSMNITSGCTCSKKADTYRLPHHAAYVLIICENIKKINKNFTFLFDSCLLPV